MKTDISIPKPIFNSAEQLAKKLGKLPSANIKKIEEGIRLVLSL